MIYLSLTGLWLKHWRRPFFIIELLLVTIISTNNPIFRLVVRDYLKMSGKSAANRRRLMGARCRALIAAKRPPIYRDKPDRPHRPGNYLKPGGRISEVIRNGALFKIDGLGCQRFPRDIRKSRTNCRRRAAPGFGPQSRINVPHLPRHFRSPPLAPGVSEIWLILVRDYHPKRDPLRFRQTPRDILAISQNRGQTVGVEGAPHLGTNRG